jgi:hypothetical protein
MQTYRLRYLRQPTRGGLPSWGMCVRLQNLRQTNFLNHTSLNAVQYLVQNSSTYDSINFPSLCKSGEANEQSLVSEHHEIDSRSLEDTEYNGKQTRPTV